MTTVGARTVRATIGRITLIANQPMVYEPGMRISYDSASMKVTVSFRGRITMIDGTYTSAHAGTGAGESYCRKLGWKPETKSTSAVSLMRRR